MVSERRQYDGSETAGKIHIAEELYPGEGFRGSRFFRRRGFDVPAEDSARRAGGELYSRHGEILQLPGQGAEGGDGILRTGGHPNSQFLSIVVAPFE